MRYFCSRCGASLDPNQTICQNCGKILDKPPHQPRFFCGECYSVVGEYQHYCYHCGRVLGRPLPDYQRHTCEHCGRRVKKLFDDEICMVCAIKLGKRRKRKSR